MRNSSAEEDSREREADSPECRDQAYTQITTQDFGSRVSDSKVGVIQIGHKISVWRENSTEARLDSRRSRVHVRIVVQRTKKDVVLQQV